MRSAGGLLPLSLAVAGEWGERMELASVIVATVALLVSLFVAWRELRLARHSNVVPVLIDLLREHRSQQMADARRFVYRELHKHDLSLGLDGLPEAEREAVRDLMCFYDNLGAIVAYDVIDVDPVVGYIGGSITDMWTALEPLVVSERRIRQVSDPGRWHVYFEDLATLVEATPPVLSRVRRRPLSGHAAPKDATAV